MKNKLFILAMAVILLFSFWGCITSKQITITRVVITRPPKDTFFDITKGLIVNVQSSTPSLDNKDFLDFFNPPTADYVRFMGLKEMSSNTDYRLSITIFRESVDNKTVTFDIGVSLKDERGKELFTQTGINSFVKYRNADVMSMPNALFEAYTQALEQINWNRIASFLRTEQLPKEEPQKQVQGYGDTALENTIIRWDVQSRPQGADIFWRVVSKTPEVKSTNNKYLMTTPYEATKSLDIKGLTYQTSGDVRIILRCEKDGYHPQEKEYNVRMIIDQEEISAFFRLVKEGE